ncbi:glycosyltransferase family 4 protein, partial [Acinetobacter baumannii]
MKKVIHIIIGLNVGGAELMLRRLVLNSQLRGDFKHEVISLTDV